MKLELNGKYLLTSIAILFIEIIIALFIHDQWIRPYVGDILVIILLYTTIKSVYRNPTKKLPMILFVFAVVVELTQLLHLASLLKLDRYKIAMIIFGSVFDLKDIICYGIGAALLVVWEELLRKDISYL